MPKNRNEMQRPPVAPTLMHEILSKTKAKEVITGHNNKGPCKSWGYIRFLTLEDRENAAVPIRDLIVRGVISPRVIKADRGPLNECWRCGAIDEDEKAAGRAPHKSHDLKCPQHPKNRDIKMTLSSVPEPKRQEEEKDQLLIPQMNVPGHPHPVPPRGTQITHRPQRTVSTHNRFDVLSELNESPNLSERSDLK